MAEKKSKVAEIKTKPTGVSVEDFINSIEDETKRKDSFVLMELMKKLSGEEPVLWSNSLIGFGNVRYKSPTSGREVDWMLIGFAPRKANLSLHLTMTIGHIPGTEKLGKYKTGAGCLYINKLADVDMKVLEEIIRAAIDRTCSKIAGK